MGEVCPLEQLHDLPSVVAAMLRDGVASCHSATITLRIQLLLFVRPMGLSFKHDPPARANRPSLGAD